MSDDSALKMSMCVFLRVFPVIVRLFPPFAAAFSYSNPAAVLLGHDTEIFFFFLSMSMLMSISSPAATSGGTHFRRCSSSCARFFRHHDIRGLLLCALKIMLFTDIISGTLTIRCLVDSYMIAEKEGQRMGEWTYFY